MANIYVADFGHLYRMSKKTYLRFLLDLAADRVMSFSPSLYQAHTVGAVRNLTDVTPEWASDELNLIKVTKRLTKRTKRSHA